jgi:hypothetical protein
MIILHPLLLVNRDLILRRLKMLLVVGPVEIPLQSMYLGGPFTQCGGNLTLDAGHAGAGYVWSNGDTSQTINVTQSGIYFVIITYGCGSVESDTAQVTINPIPAAPIITANGPTSFCPGFA